MQIGEFQKTTLIDFPGKIACSIFLAGCNFKCGYCHNPELVYNFESNYSEKEILNFLENRKKYLDGICIGGGEPTLQPELKGFIKKIKDLGFLVKLDTNGTNSKLLNELKKEKLVDYVAMDVKGSLDLYCSITGEEYLNPRDDILKGISATSQFPDYEFRTTIVPIYENKTPRWITPKEIGETAKLIWNYTCYSEEDSEVKRYILQPFKAIDKKEGDRKFTKEELPKEMWETPREHLENCLVEAQKYIPKAEIR